MPQPLEFPVHAPRVFLLLRGHPHDRPHAALTGYVAHQHPQQLVAVQPIGLGTPRAAIHFDAGGIHD